MAGFIVPSTLNRLDIIQACKSSELVSSRMKDISSAGKLTTKNTLMRRCFDKKGKLLSASCEAGNNEVNQCVRKDSNDNTYNRVENSVLSACNGAAVTTRYYVANTTDDQHDN